MTGLRKTEDTSHFDRYILLQLTPVASRANVEKRLGLPLKNMVRNLHTSLSDFLAYQLMELQSTILLPLGI